MISLRAAAETHAGYARAINEDQAVVSGDLAAVADGMGGHVGGEVAARMAIEELLAGFSRDRTSSGFVEAVRRANGAIWRRSRVDRGLRGMGTTLTAVALVDGPGAGEGGRRLLLVNIGDSRAYRLDSSDGSLARLTEDHSLVEEMVRTGELTAEEAAIHPHRHVLTRVLGIDPEVDPDVFELEPEAGLRLLLCSDGLTNEVPEGEIAEAMVLPATPEEAARELVSRALQHGGTDNVTVVVADVVTDDGGAGELPVELVPAVPVAPDRGAEEADDITQVVPIATVPLVGELERVEPVEPLEPAERPTPSGRGGRTLTVHGASVVGDTGVGAGGAETGRHRAVVLVPDRGFRRAARDRVLTTRAAMFVILLAAILGGAAWVMIWFNNSSYFVGLAGDNVAIYQGRPGGMLWFKPQLMETIELRRSALFPATVVELRHGVTESSLVGARRLVRNLAKEHQLIIYDGGLVTTTTGAATGGAPAATTPTTSLAGAASPATTTTTGATSGAPPTGGAP
ncbi:MAG: protein phosphatase 2C domain-containing protein [Acidimicrobiales bacterium]